MELALLGVIAGGQAAMLAIQLGMLALVAWRIRLDRLAVPSTPWIDVYPSELDGALPDGGRYEIVAGLRKGEPILPSGVLSLETRSEALWVFEVWARTDHGWVQLQPGPGSGTFRNSLVAGVRISALRLWLARAGRSPEEAGLRAAAGLLVPAALLLTRAHSRTAIDAPDAAQGRVSTRAPTAAGGARDRSAGASAVEAHTPVD